MANNRRVNKMKVKTINVRVSSNGRLADPEKEKELEKAVEEGWDIKAVTGISEGGTTFYVLYTLQR
jgi:hypothetical protein